MSGLNAQSNFEKKEEDLRQAFFQLTDALKNWGEEVDKNIAVALGKDPQFDYEKSVNIKPHYRLKDIDSFIKKALYRKSYSEPLIEIEDKVGTRIVVLTSAQMSLVKDILLSRNDLWDCKIGRDKAMIKESIKEFDYQAIHLIVRPLDKNLDCSCNKHLTCEIQIKTLFQHAYSEVSHDTVYKGPYRHELPLLRKLARSMALLESTDETFDSMYTYINTGGGLAMNFLTELTQQFKKINSTYDEKNADHELDSYVLDELMSENVLQNINLDEISIFVQKNQIKLSRINAKPNYLIGRHPVMILLSYLLVNCPEYLYNSDLEYGILNSLALQLGVSFEPTC